jgi:hypothetical protein
LINARLSAGLNNSASASSSNCPHVFWDTHVDWAAVDPSDDLPRKPATNVD